uniref:precorrin-6Y C5,15-methyltransferase (decarboxylating) subunit CbiT n=1 Tax=Ruminococcus flavefaciens TaxID=1265 RepID=UPI00036944CD
GDCGFFSGARKISESLADHETEMICGISSPVYFLSKLGKDWSDCFFVSLHGKSANAARAVSSHKKTFFLLGGDLTAGELCRRLCDYGMGEVTVHIGADLGYSSEKIISGRAEEFTEADISQLSVLLAENPEYERALLSGIPDEKFIRGNVPMTKSEVRAVAVAGLDIRKTDVCWDIGGGTGSVSVEMAIRCGRGRVYSVEKNTEAVSLIAENRRRFRCDNIEIVEGEASEAVRELPSPDCVFIGGSGGKLKDIVKAAAEKNSNIRLTVTAVSIETLAEATTVFDEIGFEAEISQIAVTRTRKMGNHTMMSAENPVFIIKRKLK